MRSIRRIGKEVAAMSIKNNTVNFKSQRFAWKTADSLSSPILVGLII